MVAVQAQTDPLVLIDRMMSIMREYPDIFIENEDFRYSYQQLVSALDNIYLKSAATGERMISSRKNYYPSGKDIPKSIQSIIDVANLKNQEDDDLISY